MRKYIYTLITLLLIPMLVNAETLTYNICKSGCEYSSFDEIRNHSNGILNEVGEEVFSTYDVIINFKDSETYEENSFEYASVNSLTINGNNASIITNYFSFVLINKFTVNNLNITTKWLVFSGKFDESKIGNPEYNEYKNSIININNCSIKVTEGIELFSGVFNISNSSLNSINLITTLSDVNMQNTSLLPTRIYSGGADRSFYDTNIYLNINCLENDKKIVRGLYTDENLDVLLTKYPELDNFNGEVDKYFLLEFPLKEEHINNGITKTNNIFIKQEISKAIKTNTNISEFEGEFVNTYEDSIGYDDIKDLPIEWKSENESIAKLDNGVIIPVNPGSVDLVGTRGNDIYTIHLTVEKETIPEKIDKMTIKVPITGSKIKAWVVIISILLLGIICVCVYMLIKKRK